MSEAIYNWGETAGWRQTEIGWMRLGPTELISVLTVHIVAEISFNNALLSERVDNPKTQMLLEYLLSEEFEEDLTLEMLEIHERYGELILSMVKDLCPVVTGNLRDSFFLTVSSDGVSIDSFCEYYPYIESLYGMVAAAYGFYEPQMLFEIDALVTDRVLGK